MASSGITVIDSGFDALGARIESFTKDQLAVSIGFQGPEATAIHEDSDLTNVMIAAINEYGTLDGRVPERSVIRATIDGDRAEIAEIAGRLQQGVLLGKLDKVQALKLLGEKIVALMRKRILAGIDPPNAPSTIAAKGSDKPWIDTSQVMKALSYLVSIQ